MWKYVELVNHGTYLRDLTKILFNKPIDWDDGTGSANRNSLPGFRLQSDIIVPPLYYYIIIIIIICYIYIALF